MPYFKHTNLEKDMRPPKWDWWFRKSYYFYFIPRFYRSRFLWKDKYNSPRVEFLPRIEIQWLWFELNGTCESDQYWEQWLWVYKYHNGDLKKAKEEWPWRDSETKESSWINF